MSRDPFEIGKIDSKKSIGQGAGASPLGQIGQQAALARVGEGSPGVSPAQAPSGGTPPSDSVKFSPEVDDAPGAGVSNNLLAAWGTPPTAPVTETSDTTKVNKAGEVQAASGGFTISQSPPGMSGGAISPQGAVAGQAPGMAAGGVFTSPRVQAA